MKKTKKTYYYINKDGKEIKARTSTHDYKYANIHFCMYSDDLEKLKSKIHSECRWGIKYAPKEQQAELYADAEKRYQQAVKDIVKVYTK